MVIVGEEEAQDLLVQKVGCIVMAEGCKVAMTCREARTEDQGDMAEEETIKEVKEVKAV